MEKKKLAAKKEVKKTVSKATAQEEKKSVKQTVKKAVKKEIELVQTVGMHNLKPAKGSHKPKKLLGRGSGSGHGKTSTRGSKGQTSRAGRHFYLGFEGGQSPLIRRMPKRGFTNIFRHEYQIINLSDLDRVKASAINPEILEKEGLVKDKNKPIKVLGDGEVKNPVAIQVHAISKNALEKIQKAGGKVDIINA